MKSGHYHLVVDLIAKHHADLIDEFCGTIKVFGGYHVDCGGELLGV